MNRLRAGASFGLMALLIFIAINLLFFRSFGTGHRYTSVGFTEWLKIRGAFLSNEKTVSVPRLLLETTTALVITGFWSYVRPRKELYRPLTTDPPDSK